MGASESTERSNGPTPGGSTTGPAAAIAMAAAGAAVAAWGLSKMLSDNNTTQENNGPMTVQATAGTHADGLYPSVFYRPPFQGRFRMNTDAACRPTGGNVRMDPTEQVKRGPSGYGGILRDHNGRWVRGFYGFIGVTDCLTAELHGILQGLLLLDLLCYKESVLECDSTGAVDWINHDETEYSGRSQIIKDCWDIITCCWELKKKNGIMICSISRDANKCADKLADMGIDRRETHTDIVDLPLEIKDIVDREAF
ncbi:hypothetical protein LXL04_025020 [Taraxacum kok-saghyz]